MHRNAIRSKLVFCFSACTLSELHHRFRCRRGIPTAVYKTTKHFIPACIQTAYSAFSLPSQIPFSSLQLLVAPLTEGPKDSQRERQVARPILACPLLLLTFFHYFTPFSEPWLAVTSRPIHSPILLPSPLLFVRLNSVRLYSFSRRPTIDGCPCLSHSGRPGPPPFTRSCTHARSSAAAMVMREGTGEREREILLMQLNNQWIFFTIGKSSHPPVGFPPCSLRPSPPLPPHLLS